MKDFWNDKHTTKDKYWLTGSTLGEIERYHGKLKGKVLEIGVGTGSLKEEYPNHIGVDISGITDYLTTELKHIPPVDLAICHLVFQHCEPGEVKRIINDTQLTKNGILSFQVAVLRGKKRPYYNGPLYFTTHQDTLDLIKQTNKRFISVKHFTHPEFDWLVFKVKNI